MENKDIEQLRESFQPKSWSETISVDTWEIFKVMSEMVEGFQKLTRIGPCVSIFGSARTSENEKYYIYKNKKKYKANHIINNFFSSKRK